jgi:basic amino acid/polyamine antiporter, APA family
MSFLAQFGIGIPPQWTIGPFQTATLADGTVVQGVFNLPAFLIVLVVTAILIVGVRESANVNSLIVMTKVGVVITLIVLGLPFIVPANWSPFIPPNTGHFGEFGWSGILTGAGKIFFAYIGFDAVSTAAQEAKNPQRDVPRGILGSLVACTILYVLFAAVLTGVVHYTELNTPAPVASLVDKIQMPFMGPAMKLGAIAGLTSVMLVMLYSQARIFWIMATDGLLPKAFSTLHPKFRTPYLSSALTGIVVAITGGVFPIGTLGDMVSIGTLFAFVLVCAGVLVLRKTKPDLKRPFRTPFVPVVPILGMLFCLGLMSGLGLHTWERLFIWLAIGLVIYFAYGRFHSKARVAA